MPSAATHTPPCQPLVEVQEFINGNGKPGAKTRLALLENDLSDLKDTLNRISGWVIGAMITLITGGILWIFTVLIPAAIKGL